MKTAPVYAAVDGTEGIDQCLVHTGQHYDPRLKDVFFEQLPLPEPHVQLSVGSGTHGAQTARALEALEECFIALRPDVVVVPGDVNSTLAAALAAVKLEIPVVHLEAGLRSFDWRMPEEHNRRLTDHVSSLLLTHSSSADENLAREGIEPERIALVGNTMIDTLLASLALAEEATAWRDFGLDRGDYLLATLHRPALVDNPALFARVFDELTRLAKTIPVVLPVHPRARARLANIGDRRVVLTDPLGYIDFLSLEVGAAGVVTDSGGVQEETTALGIPCFTLRDNTERPVTVTHGTNTVLGLDPSRLRDIPLMLDRPVETTRPPRWDGRAGERAAAAIKRLLESPESLAGQPFLRSHPASLQQ